MKYNYDGAVRAIEKEDLVVGNVVRMVHENGLFSAPFSDCIISKIEDDEVYLNRPGFSNKLYMEQFSALISNLVLSDKWMLVLEASGKPYNCKNLQKY
jgi:hypothetical protein